MEKFENYIVAAVMLACLCIGYVIKHLVPTGKIDRFIPLIMAALGVFFNLWLCQFALTLDTVLGGLVSGLASTGMHQMFKQFVEGGKK